MANLKGTGGIKGLLLLHGEKIGIALVALTALYLAYKSTNLEPLGPEFQADKLETKARETSTVVQNADWPEADTEQAKEVRTYKPIARSADPTVPAEPYRTMTFFDNPVIPPTIRRTDPVLLNAQEVVAYGGSGPLAFIDEDIRKQQALRLAAEAEERAQKERELAEKLAKQSEDQRSRQQPESFEGGMGGPIDPEHPKRFMVQGMMTEVAGVPIQGGERVERAYWACVVAKVPVREQLKLYQDAFTEAKLGFDPARDFPQYIGYQVQRTEVVRGKEPDWQPVPLYDAQQKSIQAKKWLHPATVGDESVRRLYEAAAQYWAGMLPDVVDERYKLLVLTLPLPPLVGRTFGEDATHPDIPLLANTPPLPTEIPTVPETAPGEGVPDEYSAFSSASPQGQVPGSNYAMPGMRPGIGRGGMGEFGPMAGPMMPGRPMMPGPGHGPEGGMAYSGGGAPAGQLTSLTPGVDHLLLRFFDYTVEPGKRYKYRVRLVLRDPNHGLPDAVLAGDVLDRQKKEWEEEKARRGDRAVRRSYRWVPEWSDPSPTVGIPMGGDVRIVSAKLAVPEKVNDEPTLMTFVESFDLDEQGNAIQSAKEKTMRRGQVANFVEKSRYLGPDRTWTDETDSFTFHTGITMLDIEGGEKLTRDATAPLRVLFMGPSGEMYVRNEIDDATAVEMDKMLFTEDKRRQQDQMLMPGGMEGFMPRGGGRIER